MAVVSMCCNAGRRITELLIYFLTNMAVLTFEIIRAVLFHKRLQMSFISQLQYNFVCFHIVKEFISLVANPSGIPKYFVGCPSRSVHTCASKCFEHKCSLSGGQNCTIQSLVSSHLQVAFPRTGVHGTATYRCDDTRDCIVHFWPPDDEQLCSKHVEA